MLFDLVVATSLMFGLIFGFELLGQKLFKVPDGKGYVTLVMVFVWGVGPVVGIVLILQGKMSGIAAFVSAIVYVAILKFVWLDTFLNPKEKNRKSEVIDSAIGPGEITNPITPPIYEQPPAKKWSFSNQTKILRNNLTGTEYKPDQYEHQRSSDIVSGFQIFHGTDVWANDWDVDFK